MNNVVTNVGKFATRMVAGAAYGAASGGYIFTELAKHENPAAIFTWLVASATGLGIGHCIPPVQRVLSSTIRSQSGFYAITLGVVAGMAVTVAEISSTVENQAYRPDAVLPSAQLPEPKQ